MAEWRHNDEESLWELGYDVLPREKWVRVGFVTDEFLAGVAATPEQLAVTLRRRFGSVPPPLTAHLPPNPPDRHRAGAENTASATEEEAAVTGEVREIELPSGFVFTGATLREAAEKYRLHSAASIAEGMCPRHASPLEPFPAQPGFIGGRCGECRTSYTVETATGTVHADFTGGLPPWAT